MKAKTRKIIIYVIIIKQKQQQNYETNKNAKIKATIYQIH